MVSAQSTIELGTTVNWLGEEMEAAPKMKSEFFRNSEDD